MGNHSEVLFRLIDMSPLINLQITRKTENQQTFVHLNINSQMSVSNKVVSNISVLLYITVLLNQQLYKFLL